jgi:mRNA interferase MazF
MSSPRIEITRLRPKRGDLFLADPGPTVGHEQHGRRPYLVVSIDRMNKGKARLTIAVPLTTTDWSNPLHVRIEPHESGLRRVSYAMPEMVRHFSALRFTRHLGRVPIDTVDTAAKHAGMLIGLGRARFS